MDEISGSTGLTGATDCNMVLQRERGQNKASLHVTGRDVEDQVLKLSFDEMTGLWSINDVPSSDEKTVESRQAILSLLEEQTSPLTPTEVADQLNLDYSVVRKKTLSDEEGWSDTLRWSGDYINSTGLRKIGRTLFPSALPSSLFRV